MFPRFLLPLLALAVAANAQGAKPLRAGVIGLDTSHVIAFTQTLNKGPKKPEDADKTAGAKTAKVPLFCSSSLRFGKTTQAVAHGSIGKVKSAETFSPMSLEPTHPDLYWYGVHGCESLFTVMGTGCKSVKRNTTPDGKVEV